MAMMIRGTSAAPAATISRALASCSGVTHLSNRSSRMPPFCRPDMMVRPKVASQSIWGGSTPEAAVAGKSTNWPLP